MGKSHAVGTDFMSLEVSKHIVVTYLLSSFGKSSSSAKQNVRSVRSRETALGLRLLQSHGREET